MVIESCVGNWKKTAWKRLDVEEIEQQCKKFSKDIRTLGKMVRTWEPFVYIERVLRNLVTSLRAITELQNSAIRDRHWLELMKATGVSINSPSHVVQISIEKRCYQFSLFTAFRQIRHDLFGEFVDV